MAGRRLPGVFRMVMLAWTDKYRTGIDLIDRQHQELFRQIVALNEAMRDSRSQEQVGRSVAFLARYAIDHFRAEEGLMARHGYPQFDEHRQEHRSFEAQIQPLQANLQLGRIVGAVSISDLLADWVRQHVLSADLAFVPFFQERGVAC